MISVRVIMHFTQKGGNMESVTGQPLEPEVLVLAAKIVKLCDAHTSSIGTARAAVQIAETAIAWRLTAEEPALSAEARD